MRIAGLFIGVDAQQDASIRALKFAGRDALVLWAIHTDANVARGHPESDTAYLIGSDAARQRVLEELDALVRRAREARYGLVHVHLSAHGLPDGRLVLSDTRRQDHAATTLALNEVTERVAEIKGKHVVLTLGCCFAGTVRGMAESANATAFAAALQALAGEERTVAWASSPEEEAVESARFSHGLFSYGLIEGLRSTYAMDGERILLERWIRHAVDFAHRESIKAGRRQTPDARMRLVPDAWIPVPPRGARQQRLLEDFNVLPVTTDLRSLAVYGFDEVTIAAIRERIGGGDLRQLQADAVSDAGVLAGRNVVVWAPTSSGKTVVGELAVLRAFRQRRKAMILLPTRALVHEQWEAFESAYGGLGIRVARSSGDVADDDDLIRGNNYDVAFATYEKFAALAFARPQVFEAVGVIVLDEVQLIGDRSRGRTVELILARVLARRREGVPIQIVALCAPVDDLGTLEQWLEAKPVTERKRPVPLFEGVVDPSGPFRYRNADTKETGERTLPGFPLNTTGLPFRGRDAEIRARMATAIASSLSPERDRLLIFRSRRPWTRQLATRLAKTLGYPACDAGLAALARQGALAEDTRAARQLRDCLTGGVAFHTRDLRRREREAVEQLFRQGDITALVATTGMAMGVNTPATVVVVADDTLYNPDAGRDEPIGVTTYRNMAGRAGRLNQPGVSEGTSYLLAADAATADRLWARYIEGPGDTLTSGLGALADEDLVLALLALAGEVSETDLLRIARSTFDGYRHQADDVWTAEKRAAFRRAVEALIETGFVARDDKRGVLRVTVRGRACAWEGMRYGSAVRVLGALDLLINAGERLDGFALLVLAQLTEELDEQYVRLREDAAILVQQAGQWFRKRPTLLRALRQSGPGTTQKLAERIKRVLALRQWVDGKPLGDVEQVCEPLETEPGTQLLQAAAERTSDVLRAILVIVGDAVGGPESGGSGDGATAQRASARESLAREVELLRARLEHGVTSAASSLSRLDLDLSRTEMHSLVAAGIESDASLYAALDEDDRRLHEILTTPGVHRLRAVLDKRRRAGALRPSRRSDREAELLSLFGEEYAL